jgi:hypothetical protein
MDQSLLEAALLGLEAQKDRLESQIASVKSMLEKRSPGRPKATGSGESVGIKAPKKRLLSPEARERIAAAQKKRWAAARRAKKG